MGKRRQMSYAFWAKTSDAFLHKNVTRDDATKRVTLRYYDCPNWSVLFSVFFKGFRNGLVIQERPRTNSLAKACPAPILLKRLPPEGIFHMQNEVTEKKIR